MVHRHVRQREQQLRTREVQLKGQIASRVKNTIELVFVGIIATGSVLGEVKELTLAGIDLVKVWCEQ